GLLVVERERVEHGETQVGGGRAQAAEHRERGGDVAHGALAQLHAAAEEAAEAEEEGVRYGGLVAAVAALGEVSVVAEDDQRVLVQIERARVVDEEGGGVLRLGVGLGGAAAVVMCGVVDL